MEKEELQSNEKAAFLKWRSCLAELETHEDVHLTPYEKNLDFWRELWRVVEKSDTLVQIVDAREPLLYYSEDLVRYTLEVDPKKNCLLLVNKSDLLTKSQSSKILNKEELLEVLESLDSIDNRSKSDYYAVGFIGYPNVGKSSTLNSLIGCKKVSVSCTPGHTKHFQTIYIKPDLVLIDCPGLVLPSFVHTKSDLVVAGILSIDECRDFKGPICSRIPERVLEILYGINIKKKLEDGEDPKRFPTAHEFLGSLCYMRGYMTSKGVPHYDRAARDVLKDYVSGQLLYCHPPPSVDEREYFYKSVDVDPNELQKLLSVHIKKKNVENMRAKQIPKVDNIEESVLSDFDKMILCEELIGQKQKENLSRYGGFRSKKHLPSGKGGEENPGDDNASEYSWCTVDSQASSVGGASLLSGVSESTYGSTINSKKPWRRLSDSKKAYFTVAGDRGKARPRKKKEKLRRIHSDLDKHEM